MAHTGIKSFQCGQCNEFFPTRNHLNSHTRHAHDETRPFQCSICNKTFKSKERLDHHFSRAHELRNCETCPHCTKQFSQLKSHLESCSKKSSNAYRPRFDCLDCGKSFAFKHGLNNHMKKVCKGKRLELGIKGSQV